LTRRATSSDSAGGTGSERARMSCCTKAEMSRPASGMCLMHDPMTYPSATGMTCVTPSPESMTVPVNVRSTTLLDVHDAASASTACTAMYSPGTLYVSNMISAICSRFSGVFSGGSVSKK
jgi:hypothetical protein